MAKSERKVGIPVDGSEHSEKACDWYLKNMHHAEDTVFIIHVSELAHSGSIETITKEDWEAHVKDHTDKVKEVEEKYKKKLGDAGFCHLIGFLCLGGPGFSKCTVTVAHRLQLNFKVHHKVFVSFEVKLCDGKPGEAICRVIKESEIDLVVMGSRGMGAIRRTFVGSVSDYVLHHSHVPTIICPKH